MAKNKPIQKAKPVVPPRATAPKDVPPKPVTETASRTTIDKWLMMVLVVLAFAINYRTLSYDYTLDDPFFTKENPFVREGTSALPDIFTHAAYYGVFKNHDASYRPFLLTSFAVEKELFGFDPHISHFINLVFFALQLVVLYLLLRKLFRSYSPWVPFLVMVLFALHPVHTEVVASIKSRDELMALLFSGICLLQSLRYVDNPKTSYLVLTGVTFFCALMSKEAPITLVVLAPLTLYFFRDAKRSDIIKATIPYAVVAAIYMLMRAAFVENDSGPVVIMVNNNALEAATNYADRLATVLYIQLKYVLLLIFPHPLSWDYSYNQVPIVSFANVKALAAVAVIGGLVFYAFRGLKKKDVFAYCIIFYIAGVIITSNLLVEIGATMAERFLYTASLAYCMALVLLGVKLLKLDPATLTPAKGGTMFAIVGVIAVLYAGKTMARNEAWQNNLTLYETGIETAPDSWRAHNLMAVEYTKQLQKEADPVKKKELYEKALFHFNRTLQILPSAEAMLMKGYAHEFGGRNDSAVATYQLAIRMDSTNKTGYNNVGAVLLRMNRLDEAIMYLNKAIKLDTGYSEAYANIAASYGNKGMFQESIRNYMIAMRQNPNQPHNVLQSISNVYKILGDQAKAAEYQDRANKAAQ